MLVDPEFVARFTRESRVLARLEHPAVVKVLDVGAHEGAPFVILQFLPGGSLRDRQKAWPDGRAPVPSLALSRASALDRSRPCATLRHLRSIRGPGVAKGSRAQGGKRHGEQRQRGASSVRRPRPRIALRNTVDFLSRRASLTRHDAYGLASLAVNFRITQVVDVNQGVHAMIPKDIFARERRQAIRIV